MVSWDTVAVTGVSVELSGTGGVLLSGLGVLLGPYVVSCSGVGVSSGIVVVTGVWGTVDDLVVSGSTSQSSHDIMLPPLHINPVHQLSSLVAKSPSS